MCAINGITRNDRNIVDAMNAATVHRGPDGTRVWEGKGVTLGFNRLAIIDLSEKAMQPMHDPSGRFTIVFNGEVYNFLELKKELSEYPFVSEGDTEVVLAAFLKWGEQAFERLNGMFALAVWDELEQKLVLARDPVGVKPLYYSVQGGVLAFSSELNGVLATGVPRVIDQDAFFHYMRLAYVPKEATMVQGVKKLLPGHMLCFKNGSTSTKLFGSWKKHETPKSYDHAVQAVWNSVCDAVSRQLVSDRPVGLYLSGGVDSTAVLAAAAQKHSNLATYSVGFELDASEEAEKFNADYVLAERTAKYFGTAHHGYLLDTGEVHRLFDTYITALDAPIGNATALAQLYLAQKTKPTATVILSGEGGDELAGGYERYRLALLADRYRHFIPPGFGWALPRSVQHIRATGVDRFAQLMFQKDDEIMPILAPHTWPDTKALFKDAFTESEDIGTLLMAVDEKNWLVDEALLRADTMGMAASIEARVPLLDLELRALFHSLPRAWKVDGSRTKKVLKDACRGRVPDEVLQQPKRGWFSPGAKWLRRPEFVALADEVFSDGYTDLSHLFNLPSLRMRWSAHREKRSYHYTSIWSALTVLKWAKSRSLRL